MLNTNKKLFKICMQGYQNSFQYYVLTLNHCIQDLQTCNLDLVLKFVLIECHTVEHHHQTHNLGENKM